jgi:hypothetical protein
MIPTDHLLRRINVFATAVLADLHDQLVAFYSDIGAPKPDARSNAAPEQFRLPDQLSPAVPDPGQPHGSVSMGGAYPRSDPLVFALRRDHLHVAGIMSPQHLSGNGRDLQTHC